MEIVPYNLALDPPLRTADGTIDARSGYLVYLDGGVGDAAPLPGCSHCSSLLPRRHRRPRPGAPSRPIRHLAACALGLHSDPLQPRVTGLPRHATSGLTANSLHLVYLMPVLFLQMADVRE